MQEQSTDPSPAAVEVRKDETARLYEALIDGQVVGTLAYETTGGRFSLTHSYVDSDMRHRGIASAMARYALEDLSRSRSEGQSEGRSQAKIGVYCGFVADYVQAHPDWKETVDINRSAFIATNTARDTTSGH
jgi:predicted GNAT family acetyltransferase